MNGNSAPATASACSSAASSPARSISTPCNAARSRTPTSGYWVDEAQAGQGFTPEGVALVARFAFETLGLHRLQISIVPRNTASRRVVEKLGIRAEGVAERYLEINGTWEDHIRFAITTEEWVERRSEFDKHWL